MAYVQANVVSTGGPSDSKSGGIFPSVTIVAHKSRVSRT